jgi:hypothetical protein
VGLLGRRGSKGGNEQGGMGQGGNVAAERRRKSHWV